MTHFCKFTKAIGISATFIGYRYLALEKMDLVCALPEAIHFFYLLEFLDYETKVAFTSGCKRFYYPHMRNYVRRISFSTQLFSFRIKWLTFNPKEDRERLWRYIANPAKQLVFKTFALDKDFDQVLRNVQEMIAPPASESSSFSVRSLYCMIPVINWMINSNISITVSDLHLSPSEGSDKSAIIHYLSCNSSLMQLRSLSMNINSLSTEIPFLPGLKSLTLVNGDCQVSIAEGYRTSLEELSFQYCSELRNVNEFGSIPSLSIIGCPNLIDISSLRSNRKVMILHCLGIIDYSQSFEKTEILTLDVSASQMTIDLQKWREIRSLSIQIFLHSTATIKMLSRFLPESLRRCQLSGKISDVVDYSYCPPHLQEISIKWNESIESLIDLRALDVPILRLESLERLTSLTGLGKRMRCLHLKENNQIKDYTAVASIAQSLSIINLWKNGFYVKAEITAKEVALSKNASQWINWESFEGKVEVLDLRCYASMNPPPPFCQIKSIPVIQLNINCLSALREYLSEGGQIDHEKIELWGPKSAGKSKSEEVISLYEDSPLLNLNYSLSFRIVQITHQSVFLRKKTFIKA